MIQQDFITKALAVVSPKAAMSRMISQEKLRNFGRFDSALESTRRGIARNISGAEDTAGTAERYKLIRAARDLADNFPPVRSLLLKFATYVSGRLSYQARTGDRDLDDRIERYWERWCRSCDFLRKHDFTSLLQLAVMAILRDGDCGFIIVRDGDQLKLQAVEADRIGSPYNRLIDSDTYIGGIMLDEYGRPDKFQIFVRTINNQYIEPTDIPAAEFIHLFDATRLDEYRGRSAFASALNATRDLQEALKAEVQAIKYASYQTGVIVTEGGGADAADYFATSGPNDLGQREKLSNIDAGTINYLSPGEKMEMFRSDRPTGAFAEFIRLVQSHICMSVGLPYGFAFDADKSGPMARMEAAMAERTFARWRRLLESQFLDRIKNIILLDAQSRGLLPENEYLLDGRWCWPAKVSIDYGREAQADIALWKAGLKTAGQIYADMGEDYEEAFLARAKEASMIKDLGIEFKIQPIRISDSVPQTVLDIETIDGEDQKPPLIDSIGIGGTDALARILDAMSQGALTPEQVALIFVEVFGMTKEAAAELISAKAPAQETPEPEPAEFQADQHKPTAGMIEEAKRGLEWRREHGRGGTNVGVARARNIANGDNLSDDTVKRMHSYFSRHEVDKKGKGFSPGEDGFPSAGRIAWALWGGDAGQTWAAAKVEQINRNKKLERKTKTSTDVKRNEHGQIINLEKKVELVMPTPAAKEEQEDFYDRCMADDTMNAEYPEEKQRFAVCRAQWEGASK
jgi:lambda family phage portal protein